MYLDIPENDADPDAMLLLPEACYAATKIPQAPSEVWKLWLELAVLQIRLLFTPPPPPSLLIPHILF